MTSTSPSIYPTIRYDDAPAAIRFLTKAFGLVAQEIDEGSDGAVNHALLRHGASLVMISSRRPGPSIFDHGTCCLYLAVDDPDAHHARAAAAGAEIVFGLTDQPYGSREYAARDPRRQRMGLRHLPTHRHNHRFGDHRCGCSTACRRVTHDE